MEDLQIIDLYWQRDEQAIRETDGKYGPLCHRIAMNILSSFQDSEECVSDTYGRCWDTMPPQRPFSLRAYVGRIVRNLSISRYRANHAQKRFAGAEVLLSELADCVPTPDNVQRTVEAEELCELSVNSRDAGASFWQPHVFELAGLLHPGRNALRLAVTGSPANRYGRPVPYGLSVREGESPGEQM